MGLAVGWLPGDDPRMARGTETGNNHKLGLNSTIDPPSPVIASRA